MGFSISPLFFAFPTTHALDIFWVCAGGKKIVVGLPQLLRGDASGLFLSKLNKDVSPMSPLQLQHEDNVPIFFAYFLLQ